MDTIDNLSDTEFQEPLHVHRSLRRMSLKMLDLCKEFIQPTRLKSELGNSCEGMLKENNDEEQKVEYDEFSEDVEMEWVAPEGGWGYVVCIGLSVLFIVVSAPSSLFGLIFKDLFEDIEDGTTGITLVHGVYNAIVSFTGFFTSSLIKRFSLRQLGLLGSLIFVMGSILTIFGKTIPYLIFSIGLLEGIGFGIMVPISMTSFNNYFIKRKAAFMGVASIFIGIGFMLYPYLIKYCKENYGLRGTLIVLCGLSFHTIFSMAVMQPAKWHLVPKKRQVTMNGYDHLSTTAAMNDDFNDNNVEEKDNDQTFLNNGNGPRDKLQSSITILNMNERKISLSYNNYLRGERQLVNNAKMSSKVSSLSNIGNWTGSTLAIEILPMKKNTWTAVVEFLDLGLLKDITYANTCFGVSFAFFSEITFFILVPVLLYHYKFTEAEVAFCMTVAAAADLVSRIVLTVFTFYVSISSRMVFYSGTIIVIILRNIFFQFTDFYHVTVLIGLLGFFRSWLLVPIPLVFAENVPKERFSNSYGLFMMVSGVVTLVLSLIVGFLKDYANNYMIAFHFLTVCSLILIIPWTIEFYVKFRKS